MTFRNFYTGEFRGADRPPPSIIFVIKFLKYCRTTEKSVFVVIQQSYGMSSIARIA